MLPGSMAGSDEVEGGEGMGEGGRGVNIVVWVEEEGAVLNTEK